MKKIFFYLLPFTFYLLLFTRLYGDMEKTAEEKAAASYTTKAKSKKEKIEFYISQGDDRLMRGEYSPAIDSYNEADNIKKNNPKVLLRLGEAYRLADMKEEAIKAYDKALEYDSKEIRTFLGLGAVYKLKFLYEKSEDYYKKALKVEKNNVVAMNGLAEIYEMEGKYQDAAELYKIIFSISPTDSVKFNIARLDILADNYDEAPKYFTASPESRILAGYINIRKNPDGAIADFTAANEWFLRAAACLAKNDIEGAKNNLDILINWKEDTLPKKLAIALGKYVSTIGKNPDSKELKK